VKVVRGGVAKLDNEKVKIKRKLKTIAIHRSDDINYSLLESENSSSKGII
jgi:hypothetical protein